MQGDGQHIFRRSIRIACRCNVLWKVGFGPICEVSVSISGRAGSRNSGTVSGLSLGTIMLTNQLVLQVFSGLWSGGAHLVVLRQVVWAKLGGTPKIGVSWARPWGKKGTS